MAVDQKTCDSLVDFLVKMDKAFDKHNFPIALRMNIYGLVLFHQFNGTRNDWDMAFQKLVTQIQSESNN